MTRHISLVWRSSASGMVGRFASNAFNSVVFTARARSGADQRDFLAPHDTGG